jgi:hypothetical protein
MFWDLGEARETERKTMSDKLLNGVELKLNLTHIVMIMSHFQLFFMSFV